MQVARPGVVQSVLSHKARRGLRGEAGSDGEPGELAAASSSPPAPPTGLGGSASVSAPSRRLNFKSPSVIGGGGGTSPIKPGSCVGGARSVCSKATGAGLKRKDTARCSTIGSADSPTPKTKTCEDMSRAQELEGRLVLADILDGCAMGDKLYAARRFRPQDAAASMKMQRTLRKATPSAIAYRGQRSGTGFGTFSNLGYVPCNLSGCLGVGLLAMSSDITYERV